MTEKYYVPRTLENWKWPRRINPHHDEVQPATITWLSSFKELSPRTQVACNRGNLRMNNHVD